MPAGVETEVPLSETYTPFFKNNLDLETTIEKIMH